MGALKLTACMKVVAKMGEMDQESLLERLDRYTSDGVPKDRAQVMAASDTLAELIDERREFMRLLREQHPDLFRVTNAIPEDQDVDPDAPDIQRSPGRSEEEIAAARADGWTIADNDLPSREVAERIVKLRTKGNSVVKPMAAWQDAEVRVVESDNPGFWAIETRKAGVKRSPARDITNTPEFKRWFGDSKVVDADGNPLVVYTGTSKDVDFKAFKIPKNGAWFTTDMYTASAYALENDSMDTKTEDYRTFTKVNTASRVIPAYLRIENPYTPTRDEMTGLIRASNYKREQGKLFERVRAQGFDGVDMGNGTWVVIGEPAQIKSAIGNDGSFDPKKADITRSPARNAMGFYSALAKGVEDMQTKAAPAGAWKTQIKGLVNKGQVKQDEIEWSGLEDFLDLQEGKVTKDQILEYLRGNGVKVEEVVLGQPSEADIEMLLNDEAGEGMSREDAIEYLSNDEGATPTKYSSYTLPGGENYREVLLTLPVKQSGEIPPGYQLIDISAEDRADGIDIPADEVGPWRFRGPNVASRTYKTREEALAALLKEAKADQENGTQIANYRSSHWDDPNVIAHIRVNDRTDADGKRVLFVEEIQSDFGQDFKKARDAIRAAVDSDFQGIVDRMKKAGLLEVECD